MIERAAVRFAGRHYVAMPDLHGSFDNLSGIRDPENLCFDIVDEPEPVRAASLHASRKLADEHLDTVAADSR